VSAQDWATVALSGTTLAGSAVAYALGRRGRRATTSQAEADAAESLSTSVVALGQRLDQVTAAWYDAAGRLLLAEQRAAAAEQRAAAAELRAATSDAELVRLRGEVASLRAELASYEATSSGPVAA
jgi:cbb3-type cytochrome oxidase subunit 3